MYTFKRPDPTELEQVCELNKYLFNLSREEFDPSLDANWPNKESYRQFFKRYFDDGNFIFAVYFEDQMVGYISGSIDEMPEDSYRGRQKIALLENLMVLPEHQKRHLGSELDKHFRQWAKRQGCNRIQVSVFAKNTKALAFYRRLGYTDYDMNLEVEL